MQAFAALAEVHLKAAPADVPTFLPISSFSSATYGGNSL
jgi:hypothetical protein